MKSHLNVLRKAEERARELIATIPKAQIYVGICGVALDFETFGIVDGIVLLRKVTNPPGLIHICRAANLEQTDYLTVSRYSLSVGAKLAVGNPSEHGDTEFLLDKAWDAAALLKLRGHSRLFFPALSDVSWDVVSGVSDNSAIFKILDDVPRQIILQDEKPVSLQDAEWVRSVWITASQVRGNSVVHPSKTGHPTWV